MKNKRVISILGCGWLGLRLAKNLISKGCSVKGSTTTAEKLITLKSIGIDPYLIQFSVSGDVSPLSDFLNTDVLVIAIPPGKRNTDSQENYHHMINQLVALLPNSMAKKLIFISSTSVYGDTNSIVNENTPPQPNTDSGKLLVDVENQLLQLKNIDVIILRLAGLIGPGRSPARFFAGKTNIPNGLAPVNLIHLDDAISLFCKVIETPKNNGIYNGCAPKHSTKQDFYTLAAQKETLTLPQFLPEKKRWKTVNSGRLKQELNFEFKYADLMGYILTGPKL